MGKVIRRWAELDWSTTGVIRAEDIPYDGFTSIFDELTARPLSPNSTYDNEIALFTWNGSSDPSIKQLKSSNTYINNNDAMGNATDTIPSEFVIRTLIEGASGYIPLAGTDEIYGDLIPNNDAVYQLGDATNRWSQIYANEIQATTAYYTQMEYNTLSSMFLVLNTPPFSGTPFADGGVIVNRGASPSAALVWDESELRWTAGLASSRENILLSGDDLGLLWVRSGTTLSPLNAGDDIHVSGAKIDSTDGYVNGIVTSTSGVLESSEATVRDISGYSILNLSEFTTDPLSSQLNDKDVWILNNTVTSGKQIRFYDNGVYYTLADSTSTSAGSSMIVANTYWGAISGVLTNQTDLANKFIEVQDGWNLFEDTFTYSLPSLIIVANNSTNADKFKVGRPLRYSIDGTNWDYGIVTDYSSGSVTIAGADFSSLNVYVQVGNMEKATQVDFKVAGTFGDAVDLSLLYNDMDTYFRWNLGTAYCVNMSAIQKIEDTSSPEPTVAFIADGNTVASLTLSTAGTWVDTTDIDTANYEISRKDVCEIGCTVTGANKDSQDLTVSCTFIVV